MRVQLNGTVLDVLEKEYDFEGKKGIAIRLVVYSDGKLEHIKISKENIQYYKDLIGQEIDIDCDVYFNGKYSLSM